MACNWPLNNPTQSSQDLAPHCDAGSMSRSFWVSQIMTDLSELLLIMILMRYQFTATMSNIVPQHSITEKRQLGPTSHAEIHNSISDSVRQYRDNNCLWCQPEPWCCCRSQGTGYCHKTQTFSRYKQNFREKADFSDINYLSWVCLPAASLVSPASVGQHPKAVMFSSRWSHIVELKT